MRFSSFFNYLFLAIVLLWPEIRAIFLPIAGKGQVQLIFALLATIVSIKDLNFWRVFKIFPIFIWLIWVIYSIINWEAAGIKSNIPDWTFIFLYIILTYLTLVIALCELQSNAKRTMRFLCVVFFLYVFIGLVFQGPMSMRASVDREVRALGNDLPLVACSALFISAFSYRQGYTKRRLFILFLVLSILSSLFVAERKTFIVTIVIAVFTLVPIDSLKKTKNWIPIALLTLFIYWGIGWVMDNTLIGERFASTTDTGEKFTDNKYLVFLGDRAAHYEGGWPLFLENPITGIGLRNYPIITFTEHPLHTEYMVQLTEGGVIGSLLFLAFAISIIKRLTRVRKNPLCNKSSWSVCLGEMLSLFLLCFITWLYDSPHYFIALAVILAYTNQSFNNNENITHYLESRRRG